MSWYGWGWRPYVPVAERRARADKAIRKMEKKGRTFSPVMIEGRQIAQTFWGKGWCDHLESHSDFENRLPRGRSYVRNGHVRDLQVTAGKVTGLVAGTDIYSIEIDIETLSRKKWAEIRRACQGKIGSLLELLQGKLSDSVMEIISHRENGIFPKPKEISMKCSCPDWAAMCKHVAAALYAVGARLDTQPELLFVLRNVDHNELVSEIVAAAPEALAVEPSASALGDADVKEIFGIELDQAHASVPATVVSISPSRKTKTKALKTARPQKPRPKRRRKARAVRDIKST
jgi:uncharacterized Zn finger protein